MRWPGIRGEEASSFLASPFFRDVIDNLTDEVIMAGLDGRSCRSTRRPGGCDPAVFVMAAFQGGAASGKRATG
jgi:hypothetical protein